MVKIPCFIKDKTVKAPFLLKGISNVFKPILTKRVSTEEFTTSENFRGELEINEKSCNRCGICESICASKAIHIDGEIKVDLLSCTFCGLCQSFCPMNAIGHSEKAINVSENKSDFIIEFKEHK